MHDSRSDEQTAGLGAQRRELQGSGEGLGCTGTPGRLPAPRLGDAGRRRRAPYLHKCCRRRSRTPTRGTHTGVRSTCQARSRDRCRPRSRTGPGRGTKRPLGAARAPGTAAPTRPGPACTPPPARFCMGEKPQQDHVRHRHCPSALSPRLPPETTRMEMPTPWIGAQDPTFSWGQAGTTHRHHLRNGCDSKCLSGDLAP